MKNQRLWRISTSVQSAQMTSKSTDSADDILFHCFSVKPGCCWSCWSWHRGCYKDTNWHSWQLNQQKLASEQFFYISLLGLSEWWGLFEWAESLCHGDWLRDCLFRLILSLKSNCHVPGQVTDWKVPIFTRTEIFKSLLQADSRHSYNSLPNKMPDQND